MINAFLKVLDILGKVWNFPNTVIGLLYGFAGIFYGQFIHYFNDKEYPLILDSIGFAHNAIEFKNNPLMLDGGAIALGNCIVYGRNAYSHAKHERVHTYQGQFLGPFYLPANILGMTLSLVSYPVKSLRRRTPFHGRLNFMEGNPFSKKLYAK